jgi:hypothetical protein
MTTELIQAFNLVLMLSVSCSVLAPIFCWTLCARKQDLV